MAGAISSWKMSEMIAATSGLHPRPGPANRAGLIGPNAILQLVPVLDKSFGEDTRAGLLARAGITTLPDGSGMIDEGPVAALHQQLRAEMPDRAAELAAEAGRGTADYILAHRIPRLAQAVLKALPWHLSARLLAQAIGKNAWTFAGSGTFEVLSPLCFRISDNPVIRGEESDHTLCHWHAAVFERLYQVLVHRDLTCTEVSCAAMGADACVFCLSRA